MLPAGSLEAEELSDAPSNKYQTYSEVCHIFITTYFRLSRMII